MEVVYVGEEMPETFTKSIFLAGPTPRNKEEVDSWRPDALSILEDKGYDGVVFIPEPRDGEFKHNYDDQVSWEEKHLNIADCIVFGCLVILNQIVKDILRWQPLLLT